jgi:hypothetical protein
LLTAKRPTQEQATSGACTGTARCGYTARRCPMGLRTTSNIRLAKTPKGAAAVSTSTAHKGRQRASCIDPAVTPNPSVVRQHMTQRLSDGRWLLFLARRGIINASPRWRAGSPDRHRRLCELRIVERSNSNEDQVRSSLGLAKQRRATTRTEASVHPIAAIRHTPVVTGGTHHLEGRCAKASANRSAACAQVLAVAAPAHPRRDRRFSALPTNRFAKATPCQCHFALQAQNGAASKVKVSGVLRTASPNPSIERTSQSLLRGLWPAAHVERQTATDASGTSSCMHR